MADDRLFHRSLGHGAKIEALTDFEYRVWTQYILSADDFGVMRYSYLPIQSGHTALGKRPAKLVQKALDTLVGVGLVTAFEHQGQAFLCQPTWQRYQKRTWTTKTLNPKPSEDVLRACDEATQALFSVHPGGCRVPAPSKSLRTPPEVSPDSVRTPSGFSPDSVRIPSEVYTDSVQTFSKEILRKSGFTRNTNANTNANANANAPDAPATEPDRDVQWEAFKAAYPGHRRQGGFMANQRFLAACETVGFEALMAALERHKRSEGWRKGMVPNLDRWFEKELWIQEPETIEDTQDALVKAAQAHLEKDAERRRG